MSTGHRDESNYGDRGELRDSRARGKSSGRRGAKSRCRTLTYHPCRNLSGGPSTWALLSYRVSVELSYSHPGQSQKALTLNPNFSFVIVHGVHGSWDNESLGSGSSEWVAEYAGSLRHESRILRFEYEYHQLFSGRRSREAIRKCALRLLRALYAARQNETRVREPRGSAQAGASQMLFG